MRTKPLNPPSRRLRICKRRLSKLKPQLKRIRRRNRRYRAVSAKKSPKPLSDCVKRIKCSKSPSNRRQRTLKRTINRSHQVDRKLSRVNPDNRQVNPVRRVNRSKPPHPGNNRLAKVNRTKGKDRGSPDKDKDKRRVKDKENHRPVKVNRKVGQWPRWLSACMKRLARWRTQRTNWLRKWL